jgi:hypothetical protein
MGSRRRLPPFSDPATWPEGFPLPAGLSHGATIGWHPDALPFDVVVGFPWVSVPLLRTKRTRPRSSVHSGAALTGLRYTVMP